MPADRTLLKPAFVTVADWTEEYFRTHREANIGHSFASLVRLFGEMAAVSDTGDSQQSARLSSLNERAEAYIQRFVRGDLAGESLATLPEPSQDVCVDYMGHVASFGDTGWHRQPDECGTLGEGRPLEGFTIRLSRGTGQTSLRYRAHLAGSGDTRWFAQNQFCGTKGQRRRVEAIWVELVEQTDRYDVFYSAHLAQLGWTGWFKNGQMCGTRGEYRRVEGIRVFIAESEPETP